MKTIEKRAEEYVEDIYIMPKYEYDSIDVYAMSLLEDAFIDESRYAFIQGAAEQREQDKEFINTWLRTHLPRIIENYQINGKNVDMLNEDMRTMLFEDWEEEHGK